MTPPDTPTRWRPRFSIRTLAVIVTLVGVYFGLWEVTKTRGVALAMEQNDYAIDAHSPMPLVVIVRTAQRIPGLGNLVFKGSFFGYDKVTYVWLGGPIFEVSSEQVVDRPTE